MKDPLDEAEVKEEGIESKSDEAPKVEVVEAEKDPAPARGLKGKTEESAGKDTALVVRSASLAQVMSIGAGTVVRTNEIINNILSTNKRVQEDADLVLRIQKQAMDGNIAYIEAITRLIEATKGKDGKIQRVTDDLIGSAEGAVGAALAGAKPAAQAPKGRLGALGSL